MNLKTSTLAFCFLFLLLVEFSVTFHKPDKRVLDFLCQMNSLPPTAGNTKLTIETSSREESRFVIKSLERLRDKVQHVDRLYYEIQSYIECLKYMGPDGKFQFFEFRILKNSVVELFGFMARMDHDYLIEYFNCTFTYQPPKEVTYQTVWAVNFFGLRLGPVYRIKNEPRINYDTIAWLEASLIYKLRERGFTRFDENGKLILGPDDMWQ